MPFPKSPKHREKHKATNENISNNESSTSSPSSTNPPTQNPLSKDTQIHLAIYIAMAHFFLALSLFLLYSLTKLLHQYYRPIEWAILCSMPLRELHTILVAFWDYPLRLGLLETFLAIPISIIHSATTSLIDSQTAVLRLCYNRKLKSKKSKIGFGKLMQWLVSFGVFVLMHEKIGVLAGLVFLGFGVLVTRVGRGRATMVKNTLIRISSVRRRRRWGTNPNTVQPFYSTVSRYLTSGILNRLNTLVAVSLIIMMILCSLSGIILFSYKIGMEGKDAVIALKTHVEENNYSERIGLQQWIDDHDVPEMMESWTNKFYDSVSQCVDSIALQYNATELVDGLKRYLIRPHSTNSSSSSSSSVVHRAQSRRPFTKLRSLFIGLQNGEWKVIYVDSVNLFNEFISVILREDLMDKVKALALQSIDVSKRVFESSTMVVSGSAHLIFKIALSIISGAAGLMNFFSELIVFFWLLYYLVASESGGVMDHVLEMLPITQSTRIRCAHVLGHAVSSVLLATVKVALFHGCFTYLLFRFYRIHFLYGSTFIAIMSAILPITPMWLSSIPAATQLAVDGRYVEAVVLAGVHFFLLDYGTVAIQDEIPGQNAYLTGLSILGGMALFPSALEGAIMGPLLMTVMIALKNLYAEFVLLSSKETR